MEPSPTVLTPLVLSTLTLWPLSHVTVFSSLTEPPTGPVVEMVPVQLECGVVVLIQCAQVNTYNLMAKGFLGVYIKESVYAESYYCM